MPTAFAEENLAPESTLTLPDENGNDETFGFAQDENGETVTISEDGTPTNKKIILHPQTGTITIADRSAGDDLFEYAEGEVTFGFYSSNRGGVEVPPDYIYDLNMEPKARHDYCTNSADQFPAPGENADFSGACARHDMCYDRADANGEGYNPCNEALRRDMQTVCKNVYGLADPRRLGCLDFSHAYYAAVTAAHLGHL